MRQRVHGMTARLAGAAAAPALALAGLVVVADPASAAACSGTSGVTVVVDTKGSISTRCASGDPSSAVGALKSAGFSVTYPVQFQGSVICRINGYPTSDPCVRMPPGDAYWAFFHAKRGGSWVYSSSGVASYDPAPGSVVGFRFGSGQQPGIAPPAPTKTSAPAPTTAPPRPKPKPKPATTAPKPAAPKPGTTATSSTPAGGASPSTAAKGKASGTPSGTPSASATASSSAGPSASTSAAPSATPSETASDIAAAPTSFDAGGGSGPGTLVAGGALVALVAAGAGWASWKRRS